MNGTYVFGGLERCDYTKGLMERGAIFEHALGKLRATGKDARFYQVTAPSRMDNPDYQRLNDTLAEEISRVNKNLQGEPLVHLNQGIPPPQNYRFMKEVEVMLVTPLEDGMNLVAFEYILSQKYKKAEERGMLALSTSGASRVLKERGFGENDGVIFVDPVKPKAAADKIVRALDRGKRLSEAIIRYVEEERRVDDWAEKNIDAILQSRKTVT
jgi:trehalose 6-phosphate synthase